MKTHSRIFNDFKEDRSCSFLVIIIKCSHENSQTLCIDFFSRAHSLLFIFFGFKSDVYVQWASQLWAAVNNLVWREKARFPTPRKIILLFFATAEKKSIGINFGTLCKWERPCAHYIPFMWSFENHYHHQIEGNNAVLKWVCNF